MVQFSHFQVEWSYNDSLKFISFVFLGKIRKNALVFTFLMNKYLDIHHNNNKLQNDVSIYNVQMYKATIRFRVIYFWNQSKRKSPYSMTS